MIVVAVRLYLRYDRSYRDVEELLTERGAEVEHVTVFRWMRLQSSTFIDAGQIYWINWETNELWVDRGRGRVTRRSRATRHASWMAR